jgi:hypothetical protein
MGMGSVSECGGGGATPPGAGSRMELGAPLKDRKTLQPRGVDQCSIDVLCAARCSCVA